MEASIKIYMGKNLFNLLKKYDFSEICITSSSELILDEKLDGDIKVETNKAEGEKCKVCWKISKEKCKRHGHL